MRKKGFTLIELLAVIVILAIIAIITTPVILGIIERARRGSIEQSALGYIDAVEKQIMMDGIKNESTLEDGIYDIKDINAPYKGNGPKGGVITIQNGKVISSNLCFEKYSVDYDGKNASISNNNYCEENKVKLIANNNSQEIPATDNKVIVDLTSYTDYTNINCNNNASILTENNQLIVTNIIGEVTCKLNNTLKDTFDSLDSTQNSIIMLKDEEVSSDLVVKENQNVKIDLNGKTINNGFFKNFGYLYLDDSVGNGKIINTSQVVNNSGSGNLIINNGYYERTSGEGTTIYQEGTGKLIINNGEFINTGSGSTVQNRLSDSTEGGYIEIHGGIFKSNKVTIVNNKGNVKVDSDLKKTYIYSKDDQNILSRGNLSISGKTVQNCSSDSNSFDSGTCIHTSKENSPSVSMLSSDLLEVSGGTIIGQRNAIVAKAGATINITNGIIGSIYTGGSYAIACFTKPCKLNISGNDTYIYAKNHSVSVAIFPEYGSIVNIKGGTIESDYYGIYAKAATVNFYAGTINAKKCFGSDFNENRRGTNLINIYGGQFNSSIVSITSSSSDSSSSATIKVMGGVFNSPMHLENSFDKAYIYYKSNINWNTSDGQPIISANNRYNIIQKDNID